MVWKSSVRVVEPEHDSALFLKKAKNPELLAGEIAHSFIGIALRRYRERKEVVTCLENPAVSRYKAGQV